VWRYDRLRAVGGEMDFTELWADVSSLAIPVMLVLGSLSGVVSSDDVTEFQRLLPDARVEVVEAAGHSIQGDQPLELARLVAEFAGLPPG
jgi:pimeloyl-ACP methyl ester carboxylesterase